MLRLLKFVEVHGRKFWKVSEGGMLNRLYLLLSFLWQMARCFCLGWMKAGYVEFENQGIVIQPTDMGL